MNEKSPLGNMPNKCPQCGLLLPAGALEGLCPACLLKQGATDSASNPPSTPVKPLTLEEVQRLFPQLEIIDFLGKGGMGAVYKARQASLDRMVALKLVPIRKDGDDAFADRFAREARTLATKLRRNG